VDKSASFLFSKTIIVDKPDFFNFSIPQMSFYPLEMSKKRFGWQWQKMV
jgi:hypothetical protein